MDQIYRSLQRHTASRNELQKQGYPFGISGFMAISGTAQNPGVFAIDCEMCTSNKSGMHAQEVIKISIVDHRKTVVYDRYVKPRYQVINYNTNLHGITKGQVDQHGVSLAEVKNYLERNFYSNTIFVGHSLEHDFRALELQHSTVVDVSLLYKRASGQKYSLQDLARMHLGRTIAMHNSVEDARAAMDLALQC